MCISTCASVKRFFVVLLDGFPCTAQRNRPPDGLRGHPGRKLAIVPILRAGMGMVDDHLNENASIVPGLGDAGDRIFGTNFH